jgi:hypothetical protein
MPRNKPLTRQISSKSHIRWRCLHYFGYSIAFLAHNAIQCWILFAESGITKPLILPEPYLRPILNGKRTQAKENFFVAMSPAQKCESPGLHRTWDNAFGPMYFLLRIVCDMPSSVSNLNNHFPSRAVFLNSRLWIPSPPWSLGEHTTLHFLKQAFAPLYK